MVQILWERGFLEGTYRGRDIYDVHTVGRKKNGTGVLIEGSALFALVSSQPDFFNEVTLLQLFTEQHLVPAGCQLMLIRSPKCHSELAGEGIKYDWAPAKQWYCRQKLLEKRTKDRFRKLVIQPMSRQSEN
jgi:hypothetical protein